MECGFRGLVRDGIVTVLDGGGAEFFDDHFRVMMHGSDEPRVHEAFYARQIEALGKRLEGARVILDVGCGPRRPYQRPPGSLIVGIDPSYESLRHNADLDLRLHGSATALPLAPQSVDAVVCFYSLHHVVGATVRDNEALVRTAFREFGRILRRSGHLLVCEVAPWWPASALQRVSWTLARRLAGQLVAMFFWPSARLQRIAVDCLPPGTELEYLPFKVSPWTTFPPAFALQALRVPRFLYPFEICMYHWRVGGYVPREPSPCGG
jgi:SAM-dependent methyltransferase